MQPSRTLGSRQRWRGGRRQTPQERQSAAQEGTLRGHKHMQFFTRTLAVAAIVCAQTTAQETYVRAKTGAKVHVYQSEGSKPLTTLEAGDLLLVHDTKQFDLPDGRRLTWHQVSAPTGFPVWVFGQFLAPTGAEGVYSVTGEGVRMRPVPEASLASYPLRDTLSMGDRVLRIQRNDPNTALAEDWVKVWSPATARAWVTGLNVTSVADSAAARAAWAKEVRVLPNAPVKVATEEAGSKTDDGPAAASPKVPTEAYRSLKYGDTLLENARKLKNEATEADFDPAIRAYNVVMEMAPKGSQVHTTARNQREMAEMLQEVAKLRDDLAEAESRDRQRLRDLQEDQYNDRIKNTITMGRFTGRGWVEAKMEGRNKRWYLRWSGDVVYEIDCGSGRYDLSMFEGYQVGVTGSTVRSATPSTTTEIGQVAMLDVARIEVLDGGK